MSFNLNKSGAPSGPAKKSNFDLSKSDGEVPGRESPKTTYWLFAAIALLVIGGAAWLLTRHETSGKVSAGVTSAAVAGPVDSAVVRPDTGMAGGIPGRADAAPAGEAIHVKPDPDSGARPAAAERSIITATGLHVATAPVIAASFRAGSADPLLVAASMAEIRKKVRNGAARIEVFGYASSEGDLTVNQTISQARADAFKKFLIRKGIAESMIKAQGKGIEDPVASNDTEEGRKKNRRVELVFQ